MAVTISITPSNAKLGDTVTVTYESTGFQTTTIQMDNMANPLTFSGDVSGSFKTLPIMNGTFTAVLTATGRAIYDSSDGAAIIVSDTCDIA